MNKLRYLVAIALALAVMTGLIRAQDSDQLRIRPASPQSQIEFDGADTFSGTNGVIVTYSNALLVADQVRANQKTSEVIADGNVRLQWDEMVWVGEHVRYNFRTRNLETAVFRTGKSPVFASGEDVKSTGVGQTNAVYQADHALITTDDVDRPFTKIRASEITVYPGKRLVARNATLYVGDVPVFWFPYYSYRLDGNASQFFFTPGYRSKYGAFLLGGYNWFYDEHLSGTYHLDYRTRRGVGTGPDFNVHLGRWGDARLEYYYLRDLEPGTNFAGLANSANRQRLQFGYDASPYTNFYVKSQVRYQSDDKVMRDYFEGQFRANPQPSTYLELNQLWDNYSLDVYAQPRVNDFFETVESLPEVKLTAFRQQLGETPLFYESESSAGYYRRLFAATNGMPTGLDYEAARADSYHQIVAPHTFFGWLNFIPRVGGRFTYYGAASGQGATTQEEYRGVFNTGAEVNFKASRLWTESENKLLDVHGLRHIIQPSINYVFVPNPSERPARLPQFAYEASSLRLLPIEFPDYNSIDSVDSQNVIRFGLANKLQTKRDGQMEDLLRWDLYTDWRLRPRAVQGTFGDLWSDLIFRPRNWLSLESQTRFDVETGNCKMSFHNVTFEPNNKWSWSIGHWYLRNDFSGLPNALGAGNDLITSTAYYRMNENWAFRLSHFYEIKLGRLQEQYYTVYRDFRNWTGAMSFRVRDSGGEPDYTVAFTFSLKAMPRRNLGADVIRPYELIGN